MSRLPSRLAVCFGAVSAIAAPVRSQGGGPAAAGRDSLIGAEVDSLLRRMTLEEKIGQLTIVGVDRRDLRQLVREGKVGATNGVLPGRDVAPYIRDMQQLARQSRLRIPLLFAGDVIHGFRTVFPVPIAVASSWDPGLVQTMDSIAAIEATAAGVDWTFAPMVDINRDPRWGRVVEGAGEDLVLGEAMAAAAVRGFQGRDPADPTTMMATAKHFAGYGAVEAGRDYNTADMSERRLRSVYLPPFRAAVDQGVGAIMAAFVSLNGTPVTGSARLLTDLLRREWGFRGIVVSDYDAIPELQQHGFAGSPAAAAREAITAGIDVDLHSGTYLGALPGLIRDGQVPMSAVDAAVRRVLHAKFALGLFEDPFRYGDSARPSQPALLARHRPAARDIARRSMVLLKNAEQVLPLQRAVRSIAVIGPLADDRADLLGPVHALGRPEEAVTVLQGIRESVSPRTTIHYVRGTGLDDGDTAEFAAVEAAARQSQVVVAVVGEGAGMSGEGDSRSRLGLPGRQLDLVRRVWATGTPVVVVLINGRPLTIPWVADHAAAILEAWLPGTEGGPAVADVLFGAANPSGKLPMTFPRDEGQIPLYYAHLNTGRPFQAGNKYTSRYIDVPNTPLYPFGFGLSYTTFSYSPLRLDTGRLAWNDTLHISVTVTNSGGRDGAEVVQLYVRDLVGSVTRPVKELKAFRRVSLAAGASRQVSFALSRADLAFYGQEMRFVAEPGRFEVSVGGSSDQGVQAGFTLLDPRD